MMVALLIPSCLCVCLHAKMTLSHRPKPQLNLFLLRQTGSRRKTRRLTAAWTQVLILKVNSVIHPAFSQKTTASAVHHSCFTHHYQCMCEYMVVCTFLHCPKHSYCHVWMHIEQNPLPHRLKLNNNEMRLKQLNNANKTKAVQSNNKKFQVDFLSEESNIHSSLLKASRLHLSLCFRGLVQTLQATLCGHFLPRPRGGEITRNKLYISL